MTTLMRSKVTFADVLWVAWRRHRTLILVTAGLVAALAVTMVWAAGDSKTGPTGLRIVYYQLFWSPRDVNLVFGATIAVFWGAPLVAREYEARTTLVAWGQDVPATRWLAGQVALLGAATTCLAAVVWLAEKQLTSKLYELSDGHLYEPFTGWFEVAPQLQIGYALFGYALGVAASVLVRRTLPAMGIALVVFGVVRVQVMNWPRAHYLPPVHTFEAWNDNYRDQVPDYAMYVSSGYADANGVPIGDHDWVCDQGSSAAQLDCLKGHGVAGHYAEFQPVERVDLFRWIETGIFVVLAAGLLVLAWTWLKRARRV